MMIQAKIDAPKLHANYNGFSTLVPEEIFLADLQMDGRLAERVINWTESLADRVYSTAPNSFPFFPVEQLTFDRCRLFFMQKSSFPMSSSKFFSRIPLQVWTRLKEEKQANIFRVPLKDHVICETLCQEPVSREDAVDFLRANPEFFSLLPDRFKTTAIIDEVSVSVPRIIHHVPANLWSGDSLIRALEQNVTPPKYVPEKFYENPKIVKLLLEKGESVPYSKLSSALLETTYVRIPLEFDSLARINNYAGQWIEWHKQEATAEEAEKYPRESESDSSLLFSDKNQRDLIDRYGEDAVKFLCQKKYRIRDETWKWILEKYPTIETFCLLPLYLQTAELIEQMAFLEDFPDNIRHCDMRKMRASTAALIAPRITDDNYQRILEDILKNGGLYERAVPEGQILLGSPWRLFGGY